eukprot:735210-Prymnesium_polylepis.1
MRHSARPCFPAGTCRRCGLGELLALVPVSQRGRRRFGEHTATFGADPIHGGWRGGGERLVCDDSSGWPLRPEGFVYYGMFSYPAVLTSAATYGACVTEC